jgi:hypothetical protein
MRLYNILIFNVLQNVIWKNLLQKFLVERQFVANFALKKNLKNNRK